MADKSSIISTLIKKAFASLARREWSWVLIKPFAKLGAFLWNSRNEFIASQEFHLQRNTEDIFFREFFPEKKVLNGPFKGLLYPSFSSVGSALFPKLIGSYEKEIHHIIESLLKVDYSEIINIGCGEGYYAVGLGLQFQTAKVFAFDTDEEARRLCHEMALINGVADKVIVGSLCTPLFLKDFKFTSRGLIICDCEGCEGSLFDKFNLPSLINCDLLIETHDFIDIEISDRLKSLFSKTHFVQSIYSIDDILKAKSYAFAETTNFDLKTKRKLLAEGRPAQMEWIFFKSKRDQ